MGSEPSTYNFNNQKEKKKEAIAWGLTDFGLMFYATICLYLFISSISTIFNGISTMLKDAGSVDPPPIVSFSGKNTPFDTQKMQLGKSLN